MRKILFVHIPKTAGTSFREALSSSIGSSSIFCDYGENSPETSALFKNNAPDLKFRRFEYETHLRQKSCTSVIYGHFKAKEYQDYFSSHQMGTFLREPVARTISAYLHHKRHFNFKGGIVDFCERPDLANRQSQFLDGIDISKLGFIGITERYNESLKLFNKQFGISVPYLKINVADNYPEFIGRDALSAIVKSNTIDIELYNKALGIFKERLE